MLNKLFLSRSINTLRCKTMRLIVLYFVTL